MSHLKRMAVLIVGWKFIAFFIITRLWINSPDQSEHGYSCYRSVWPNWMEWPVENFASPRRARLAWLSRSLAPCITFHGKFMVRDDAHHTTDIVCNEGGEDLVHPKGQRKFGCMNVKLTRGKSAKKNPDHLADFMCERTVPKKYVPSRKYEMQDIEKL